MTESSATTPSIVDRRLWQETTGSTAPSYKQYRTAVLRERARRLSTTTPARSEKIAKMRQQSRRARFDELSPGTQGEQLSLFHSMLLADTISASFYEDEPRIGRKATVAGTATGNEIALKLQASSSTSEPKMTAQRLRRKFKSLFLTAREERFDDGMASAFSRSLIGMIEVYGSAAVAALEPILTDTDGNLEIVAEALRWLPFVADNESYKYRQAILKQALNSPSIRVRDSALVGLASMDDPRTLDALEISIEREGCAELREQMLQVHDQLRRVGRGALSQPD